MYSLLCFRFVVDLLDDHFVLRLQSFLALNDYELYTLAFIQVTVSITNNGIVMDEYIITIFRFNETVAFATIEPFYGALLFFSHGLELLS